MDKYKVLREGLEPILESANHKDAIIDALVFLFPEFQENFNRPTYRSTDMDSRYQSRRLNKPEFAENYFDLSPDETVWSQSQIDELVGDDPSAVFEDLISRLSREEGRKKQKLISVFLDVLEGKSSDAANPFNWFIAIINYSGLLLQILDETRKSFYSLRSENTITLLLARILTPLSELDRSELFIKAIRQASDISFLCNVFRYFAGDIEPDGAQVKSASFGDRTDEVRNLLLARVQTLAKSDQLHKQIRLEDVLWFWWGTGNGKNVRRYFHSALHNQEAVAVLLDRTVHTVFSTAGDYETINRNGWKKIGDITMLSEIALDLSKQPSDPNHDAAIRFLAAYQRSEEEPI